MTARSLSAKIAAIACATALACACMGMTSCSKPKEAAENQPANAASQAQAPENSAIQDAKQAADAAQAAALIESQRQAAQQQEEKSEAAIQKAYDANPASVEAGVSKYSEPVVLTGTVRVKSGINRATSNYESVYMLSLPRAVVVTGTQYGEVDETAVILDDSFDPYCGQIVSIRARLGVIPTASIASAEFSAIHASEAYVTCVF